MLKKFLTFGLTPEQEDRYRTSSLAADLAQARISMLLILVTAAGFLVNDYSFVGLSWQFYGLLALRIAFLVHGILLLNYMKTLASYRSYDRAGFAWGLLMVVNFLTAASTRPDAFIVHAIVAVMITFVALLTIPNRFVNQIALSLAIIGGEVLIIAPSVRTSPQVSVTVLFSMFAASSIAIVSAWQINFLRRWEFLSREKEKEARAAAERELSERRRVEEALRESEEKYRTILETMQEGLFENDLKGNYTYVNDAACRMHGFQREEFIGMNYRSVFPPEAARFLSDAYRRIYKTGETELLMDHEVTRRDGSIRIHQANVELVRDSSGRPIGFRTLAWDVTERRKIEKEKAQLEEQLVQAQKMESVGRLAGGVAHDFNNMLGVILGYAELIRLRLPRNDPLLKELLEIERAAARSRDLAGQLLAFSRKQIITPVLVDLNDLIMSMEKTLSRLIGEDVDLQFYPGGDLWKIKFDPSQMQQVLINLAANARDAMPAGGKLTIETANLCLNEAYCKIHLGFSPGYYVLLGVSDDGAGMDKETLQHLFEPFFTTKEAGRGTGLGLATVYGIVKQNNGFINVYSEPGKGTTFKIYISRSLEEGDMQKGAEEELVASGSGTVLLVEDDDMVRAMTSEMLEEIGYTVVAAGSPAEAESLCENGDVHIDLLLTDVVMPGISGKELRDRIQAKRPVIKVLFMSGYTSNVIAHHGVLEAGVHFIQKPFSMNDLARKAREAIVGR
ncbi:MAG: hypothetical protein A2W19_07655 [Spirochaetes bacterium RBG_16_49_21]|nr:MAG: hypothetical protein A2W19_07655 [Spirochaetes bacterium RBG_16_49_21]